MSQALLRETLVLPAAKAERPLDVFILVIVKYTGASATKSFTKRARLQVSRSSC